MDFNLAESVVRQHLRDNPGEVYCAGCLARDLGLDPGAVVSPIMALLAERQPPFAAGRCGCGASGLMYVLTPRPASARGLGG